MGSSGEEGGEENICGTHFVPRKVLIDLAHFLCYSVKAIDVHVVILKPQYSFSQIRHLVKSLKC